VLHHALSSLDVVPHLCDDFALLHSDLPHTANSDGNHSMNQRPAGRAARKPRETLADQVALLLEDRILDGKLAPGQRLPVELDLAADLRVSRTVVRDAVRSLAARGLVDVRQGSGTMVTTPSPNGYAEALAMLLLRSDSRIGDLWTARQTLETSLGLAAMRSEAPDWRAVEKALGDYARALDLGRWGDAEDAHNRFHLGLLTALRNPVIDTLVGPMQQVILMSARAPWLAADPSNWAEDFELHEPVLKAAVAGDESAFLAAMDVHYHFVTDPRYADFRSELLGESPIARGTLRRWQRRRHRGDYGPESEPL
jgi:DNA-binding FadR family transcriptional regulator